MQDQIRELVGAVTELWGQPLANEVARNEMKQRRCSCSNGGVDTRNRCGMDELVRGVANLEFTDQMTTLERKTDPVIESSSSEQRLVPSSLAQHGWPALDRVINAGAGEGFRVWQLMSDGIPTFVRGLQVGCWNCSSGDVLGQLEAFERKLVSRTTRVQGHVKRCAHWSGD